MIELLVVGGGKMGEALLGGLLDARWAVPAAIAVVETLPERAEELRRRFDRVQISAEPVPAAAAVLAVKPADVPAACAAFAALGAGAPRRVLSIAAGVTLATLEAALAGTAEPVAVVRAMPNTPALVRLGAAAIAPGAAAGPDDLAWARSVLEAVGSVAVVAEHQLDAVTGLSGSGPAYVFMIAEAMIEAGVLNGLARPVAEALAVQTLLGSASLLATSDRSPGELRADVTSPGGTTAAGLHVLEQRAVRAAFLDAVSAATARSAELGRS